MAQGKQVVSKAGRLILVSLCMVAVALCMCGFTAAPSSSVKTESVVHTAAKTKVFKPTKNAHKNYKKLNKLVSGNKAKVIKVKQGSNFKVDAPIRPGNNTTIDMTGSTISITKNKTSGNAKQNLIFPYPNKKVKNLTIIGGNWRSTTKGGYKGGLIAIAHGTNITLRNMDANANYDGHAFEIMACKNVTIDNCKIWATGTCKSTCKEEALQIDLTTPKTTPQVAAVSKKLAKGQTCSNVTVTNCYISGARGMCVNYLKGAYVKKYHKNVTVKNCVIVGETSEALSVFNTLGATIENNVLVSRSTKKTGAEKSMGLALAVFAKNSSLESTTVNIKGNKVYGNRNAISVRGLYNSGETQILQRYGTVNITGNECYSKGDQSKNIFVVREGKATCSAKALTNESNVTGAWDGSKVAATWNSQALAL